VKDLAETLPADPMDGIVLWLNEASSLPEPSAMSLATSTRSGRPSVRVVLFKGFSLNHDGRRSPRFFTNYTSRKSLELEENPHAALAFHWATLNRQIRIEGAVEKTTYQESDEYFQTRGRGSQIGAWSSPQSRTIEKRGDLEKMVEEVEHKFSGKPIPCPDFWGGWRLVPERVEFWSGMTNRLHDRIVYEWTGRDWKVSRIAP
jgi:pyridoxamine 5'-phosphate oxidase